MIRLTPIISSCIFDRDLHTLMTALSFWIASSAAFFRETASPASAAIAGGGACISCPSACFSALSKPRSAIGQPAGRRRMTAFSFLGAASQLTFHAIISAFLAIFS